MPSGKEISRNARESLGYDGANGILFNGRNKMTNQPSMSSGLSVLTTPMQIANQPYAGSFVCFPQRRLWQSTQSLGC
jgi:hypothetical protein